MGVSNWAFGRDAENFVLKALGTVKKRYINNKNYRGCIGEIQRRRGAKDLPLNSAPRGSILTPPPWSCEAPFSLGGDKEKEALGQ